MKKIIITGGIGYIGMELCKLYSGRTRFDSILVIDKSFSSSRVSQLRRWGIDYKQIDILDSDKLKKYLHNADLIYHLAGVTDVPTLITDKQSNKINQIKRVGVVGTKNIIKYSSKNSKIVFPSTHVIFEGLSNTKKEISEKETPLPILDYAKGKYQSEIDLATSGKNFVILRLGSVHGLSYDSMRLNIMPNLFSKQTALNLEINLHSGGKQIKSLVNVIDVARCMQFVGEDQSIKNEVFNCVSESMTVKDVSKICKELNKELKIYSSPVPTPNDGYSLSNKKIKSYGFEFLYPLESSIKEMFNAWKSKPIIIENEKIETGKDEFIDSRGIISNYYFEDNLNMIGYVESKKNTLRGNHFHPIQTQKCLLIQGSYISVTKDLSDPNSVVETKLIKKGDLSTIPPYVAHTMLFLEDSVFLNLVNGDREHLNFGITHTYKYELVDEKLLKTILKVYKPNCRVCNENKLNTFLSLGLSPLANNLIITKFEKFKFYPLELNLCENCFNVQLSVSVPKKEMFDSYLYLSSTTESFRNHFFEFAKKIKQELNLNKKSLVVDIGSNDGIFLKPLKNLGIKIVGIEPAKNIANNANNDGLFTLQEYFSAKTVSKIKQTKGKADLVTAFNVFAHNDNLNEMLTNVSSLLKDGGEFVFEVQYFLRTLLDLTFDNIYHEHVNYWTVSTLLKFFEKSDLTIYKIEEIETHGGSIRVYSRKNKKVKLDKSVPKYLKLEKVHKLDSLETYLNFSKKIKLVKTKVLEDLIRIKSENKAIIGYGAPAKATTLLNFFGISDKYFSYTIEDNILKNNKFIPGTFIQIKNINDIDPNYYDFVVVLAWNYFFEIKNKNKKIFKNAKFILLK